MSTIITIFFLILLNGFFALSEMAIVTSRKPKLLEMARKGNKGAENVLKILQDQGKFLSAIQVGITAVGTLASVYGGATIAHNLGEVLNKIPFMDPYGYSIAMFVVVVFITYVSVIIGELVPKRIALRSPENISIFVASSMLAFANLFLPIVKFFDLSAEIVMKFFGVFGKNEDKVTEAELRALINEGAESGVIEKSEHEMMQRIFRLDDRDAKSIMTHIGDVVFLKVDETEDEIKQKLIEAHHSRYPVFNADSSEIIGVVEAKEILSDYFLTKKIDIKKHLQKTHFISENVKCLKVLEMFKTSSIELAIIVDEYGAPEGLISSSDILEAVVGLIPANYDEHDQIMIKKREDGSWLVDGTAPIDEINIIIGIDEIKTEGEYDTIAGFVAANIGDNLTEGFYFTKYGFKFEIIDLDGVKIDKILISVVNF